jgi:HD-GYP domain-containing protein (c-di-GMP phosphodiesterase class II)
MLCHHERLDGSGYPHGLKGARISLGARILAVADTYDAIRAGRPYSAARPAEEALRELRRCRGTRFDSSVVDALARCQDELGAALLAQP